MPRGVRAVHGHDVQGGPHGRGNTVQELVAIIPTVDWLQVTCWCEDRIVAVAQRDLVEEGITYSCGLVSCQPPEGVPLQVAMVQWKGTTTMSRANPADDARKRARSIAGKEGNLRGAEAAALRAMKRSRTKVYRRSRKAIKSREAVAERRDRVRELYLAGKQYQWIAHHLGIKYETVVMDVYTMRNKGWL